MSRDGTAPPGGTDGFDDIDRRFSEIVAHLQNPQRPDAPESQSPPQPAAEADDRLGALQPPPSESHGHPSPHREGPEPSPQDPPPGPAPVGDEGSSHAGTADTSDRSRWREWEASSRPDPADDHFIPPEPAPLPAGDLHFWAILAGLTLGPLVLLLSTVIPLLDSPVWSALGVIMSVAGFVLLVLRSPGGDDDWGAQV